MGDAGRQLIGRGSVYTLGSAAPMLAGLLVTPVLTRSVSVAEYGGISVAIVVMQWSVTVLVLGLPVAITRHALTESSADSGARGITLVGALLVLAGSGAVAGLIAAWSAAFAQDVPLSVVLAVVAGGAGAGVAMAQAWALAGDRGWFYVLLAMGVTLIAPAVGLAVVQLFGSGGTAYMSGVLGAVLFVETLALIRIRTTGRPSYSWRELGRCLRVGLPMVPHLFATGSATGIAVMVSSAVLGATAAGQAQVAIYVGTVMLIVISAVSYAWTPIILRAPEGQRGVQLAETAVEVTWLAALGGATVAVLSPWLLRILVPASFDIDTMVPVTALVCITASIAAVYLAHSQLVVASGRTLPLVVLSPLALLIGATTSYAAVSGFGLVGVAVGYLATYALLWLFIRALARRVSPVRWAERGVVLPVAVSVAACVAGVIAPVDGIGGLAIRGLLALVFVAMAAMRVRSLFRSRKPSVFDAPVESV